MKLNFCLILILFLSLKAFANKTPAPKPASPLDSLVNSIQNTYNKTNQASFSFTQTYKSPNPLFSQGEISKGEVFFEARKMMWRYDEPANRKREFYIADKNFTYYDMAEKLAWTHNCFDQDTLSASITFLWRKGNLKDSFIIKPYTGVVDKNSSLKWLTLIPKEANPSVKSISLGVDPKTGLVKESIVIDAAQGVNKHSFSNYKINPKIKIPPETFVFKAKPGVRIQPAPNVTCPAPKEPQKTKPAPKRKNISPTKTST